MSDDDLAPSIAIAREIADKMYGRNLNEATQPIHDVCDALEELTRGLAELEKDIGGDVDGVPISLSNCLTRIRELLETEAKYKKMIDVGADSLADQLSLALTDRPSERVAGLQTNPRRGEGLSAGRTPIDQVSGRSNFHHQSRS